MRLPVLYLALLLQACTAAQSVYQVPDTSLSAKASYIIIDNDDDREELAPIIQRAFETRGIKVSAAAEVTEAKKSDYMVHYSALWHWDMTWYMSSFIVSVHDPESGLMIATAYSRRSSLRRSDYRNMVDEAMTELFTRLDKGA